MDYKEVLHIVYSLIYRIMGIGAFANMMFCFWYNQELVPQAITALTIVFGVSPLKKFVEK